MIEVPLTLPLDAELPPEREDEARRALERAREVGEEYEDVEVNTEVVRARKVGAGILEAARRSGAEAIVIGGEPPTQDPRRRRDRRNRRRQAGRDRRRDRVRAEESALPGAADAPRPNAELAPLRQSSIRRHVHPDRRLRPSRLLCGAGDAPRGPRGLLPRRGPRVPRPPRGRAWRRAGRTSAASSRSAPASRPRRWSPPGSRRPTSSSPPPTATTPTSSSPRSPSAATTCRP